MYVGAYPVPILMPERPRLIDSNRAGSQFLGSNPKYTVSTIRVLGVWNVTGGSRSLYQGWRSKFGTIIEEAVIRYDEGQRLTILTVNKIRCLQSFPNGVTEYLSSFTIGCSRLL